MYITILQANECYRLYFENRAYVIYLQTAPWLYITLANLQCVTCGNNETYSNRSEFFIVTSS